MQFNKKIFIINIYNELFDNNNNNKFINIIN